MGAGYDLILSKNTLKNGYIHPERPVDRSWPEDSTWESSDAACLLASLHSALEPGGRVLIYNICPAQSPPDSALQAP